MSRIFLAATRKSLARAEQMNGAWQVTHSLDGLQINCLAGDPIDLRRVYAGTQKNGVLVSNDAGATWNPAGLKGTAIKSLAVSPHDQGTIYAGCKPVSLYRSLDHGESWEELEGIQRAKKWWWFSPAEPPDWRPYVMALAISPSDPAVMMAGIELGGVLRSTDSGRTWSKHRRGAVMDCHSLKFHPTDGRWVYEGGGGGAALSQDGGVSWRKPKTGLTKKYGWMVAADSLRPEVWYLSASGMPNLLRGQFAPPAHVDGKANASIFRSIGGAPWEKLSGGLPEPLDYMAYALTPDPGAAGSLFAGLSNGEVWRTKDYGDRWEQMPFNLGGIQHAMIMI